ncbi:TetR/AcrR family transcriptional regulator C-terminal domain-containing protein [Spirillospora sp. CA-128828]|uniref:TetR/AcrR family transcriptional regulator C-terminal domain-containing protein n=1 Tax=Spirillospora sp. CA-128828 TaxID=3240033 RepID=UPI003D915B62
MTEKQRPRLTRRTVIDAALQLLNEVGLDGLTVRLLASKLGVQNPALYWHFRNKQELLDGMAEAITLAAGTGSPRDDETWQDWITHRSRQRRRTMLAYRDGARIVANARLSPSATRVVDQELTAMVGCGFTPVLALRTAMTFVHYVNGFVLQEQTQRHEVSAPPAALAQQLDGGDSAILIIAIRDGGSTIGEQAFEYGLQTLVHGATAALAAQHSDPPA